MTRYKQFLSTAVALALIAGPAAPGASRTPPLKKHPVPDNDSPVRCNDDRMDGDGAIAVSAQRRGQTSPRYAPQPYPVMAPPPPAAESLPAKLAYLIFPVRYL